ncbi:MAG: SdrD B-like domain-containing protein [Chloroflexota bacterium]
MRLIARKVYMTAGVTLTALLVALAISPLTLISFAQQTANGSICVLAFNDANHNSVRDPGEAILSDVSVNLMINEKVIIANHVTDGKEPFCFPNLAAQQYTVSFSSPLNEATTSTSFSFSLANGEQTTREFGAVPLATNAAVPTPTNGISVTMTLPVRIGLSAVAALLVMIFVGAIGLIIYGLLWAGRR